MLQRTVGNQGADAAVAVGEVNIRMASMIDGTRGRGGVEVAWLVGSSVIVVDFSA